MRSYTFEEKKTSVERYLNGEATLGQIGREFKTAPATIRQWVVKYQEEGDEGLKPKKRGFAAHPRKPKEKRSTEDEIRELRKEVDCLKKALVHFAEERISKK